MIRACEGGIRVSFGYWLCEGGSRVVSERLDRVIKACEGGIRVSFGYWLCKGGEPGGV